jgi:hypothetical protein
MYIISVPQFSEKIIYFHEKFAGIKKGYIFAALLTVKNVQKEIKKFFDKIEASLAEANSSKINTPIMVKLQVQEIK